MPTRRVLQTQALTSLPAVFTGAEAAAAGISARSLDTLLRRSEVTRLRRGMYCTCRRWAEGDRREQHVLQTMAAQRVWDATVASHLSAAAAWGWPLPLDGPGVPWLTRPSPWTPGVVSQHRVPARREAEVRLEAAVLTASEKTRAPGHDLCVTTRSRTVADCLRHLPALESVPIVDAAVAGGLSRADLAEVLARQAAWPFAERATASLALVDPRRETWLESFAAVGMIGGGLPFPEAQPVVRDRRGRFVARPDLWLEEFGVVVELDGREKYRLAGLTTPSDAERLLRDEKDREDRLRDLGLEVARGGTAEAARIELLLARIGRAIERGDRSRVTARITPAPWPAWWPRP